MLVKQEKATNKCVKNMKLVVQEVEQKMNTWEENFHRLDNTISCSCKNFTEEGITK